MAISMQTTLRNTRADAITTALGASPKLMVYTAAFATKLFESICNATFAPAAASGVLTANAIANGTGLAAGTAAVARLYKNDGTTLILDNLTVAVSGANVNITNLVIAVSDVITTSALTITEGNP